MFGGAESGKFQMSIRHIKYGLVDTKNMILDVSAEVYSFSPKIGSIFGGTLLTIKGRNFGKQKTDNPVQISYNGGVGSTNCWVQTTAESEITCRVDTKNIKRTDGEKAALVVFLKVSEEAKCDDDKVCNYKYTATIPKVTEMKTEFDAASEKWQVKIKGTNLGAVKPDLEINKVN
jgi:hypothetical protein